MIASHVDARAAAWLATLMLTACATPEPPAAWESRLRGDAVVLLGEVHDNAEQHRLRLAVLRRALSAGWRPAIAMEQFDIDRQADIDRARRERPRDAQHLIEAATAPRSGWDWALYRPVVALALAYELPLIAANLPNADANRLVRNDYAAVLGGERTRALGLAAPPPADLQSAQEREIDAGHCARLPVALLPGMVRAQLARDALMAQTLTRHAANGVVLLAGNGHVRRDLGVPRWLPPPALARAWAVGFIEAGDAPSLAQSFDATVVTAATPRERDLCDDVVAPKPKG